MNYETVVAAFDTPDHADAAVASFKDALTLEQRNIPWRLEYIRYLLEIGRTHEAMDEVNLYQGLFPGDGRAEALVPKNR